MNLNVDSWKDFHISDLFEVDAGNYYYQDDYSDGDTPYCSASAENNGVSKYIDIAPDFLGNKIITGKVGCTAFYQRDPFCATSDVNVLTPKFEMSEEVGIFITTIINKNENYRWNYGRQCRVGNTKKITIRLPVCRNEDDSIRIDESYKFSPQGYVPDFEFMQKYIHTLHHKPIKTKIATIKSKLDCSSWKEFYIYKLFNVGMGNGIDAVITTSNNPKYNYVSRDSNGNGVVGFVDEIDGETPFPAGAMSLALGGSFLGSCFIQKKPFYTAQNVAVLQEKRHISDHIKLFIAALIRNECKIKYQAFGRELNSHYKKDFTIKLPVLHDENGIVIDASHEFSDKGYIPDWEWMDNYMKSLPYSDRI